MEAGWIGTPAGCARGSEFDGKGWFRLNVRSNRSKKRVAERHRAGLAVAAVAVAWVALAVPKVSRTLPHRSQLSARLLDGTPFLATTANGATFLSGLRCSPVSTCSLHRSLRAAGGDAFRALPSLDFDEE
ncbi:hypothetical protein MRX96_026396 [Rhipicephalus microplus]